MSASDEAVELLPCPFCGKSDIELRQSITDAYIACNECGCRTGLAYYGSSDARNAWEDRHVAKIWNTRANHTAAMKEALERIKGEAIDAAEGPSNLSLTPCQALNLIVELCDAALSSAPLEQRKKSD